MCLCMLAHSKNRNVVVTNCMLLQNATETNVVYDNFQDILVSRELHTFQLFIHATKTTNLWSQQHSSFLSDIHLCILVNAIVSICHIYMYPWTYMDNNTTVLTAVPSMSVLTLPQQKLFRPRGLPETQMSKCHQFTVCYAFHLSSPLCHLRSNLLKVT